MYYGIVKRICLWLVCRDGHSRVKRTDDTNLLNACARGCFVGEERE
jgi:hypothetical protein